jgi:hypothetical protein
MVNMLEKAILKVQREIGNGNNPYITVIGEFLLKHLKAHPEAAEKIMQADKTIAKSLDAMKAEAKKKAVGGCAMLTDTEGFEIVLKYFGIGGQVSVAPEAPEAKPAAKDIDFDVSLDDFI